MRSSECGMKDGRPEATVQEVFHSAFRTPHSESPDALEHCGAHTATDFAPLSRHAEQILFD